MIDMEQYRKLVRQLRGVEQTHINDHVFTGEIRVSDMAHDSANAIEALIEAYQAATATPLVNGDTSDGYHTFNELYHHRAVLFAALIAQMPDKAWKSKHHADGSMYDGWFIVGIETPKGMATYHYAVEPYWDMYRCRELARAPEWDGHTPAQAIERIGALASTPPNLPLTEAQIMERDDLDAVWIVHFCVTPEMFELTPTIMLAREIKRAGCKMMDYAWLYGTRPTPADIAAARIHSDGIQED